MNHTELQRGIISIVLTNHEYLDKLIEKTSIEYFDDKPSKKVYKWLKDKFMNNESFGMAKFVRELDIRPVTFEVDGAFEFEFDEYLEILHKDYIKKQIAESAKEIHALTKKEDIAADELQSKAQDLIFEATVNHEGNEQETDFEDALMKSYEAFTEELEEGRTKGLETHIPTLDMKIGGLQKGHLIVLAGETSMGKTAKALNIVKKQLEHNKNVSFISLEMNDTEIVDRLVVMDSHVNATDFNNRFLSEGQQKNIEVAYDRLHEYRDNLKISYKRGMTVEDIKAKCRKYYREMEGLDLIVIDYLQRIKLPGKRSTNKEVGQAVNEIRDLAGELEVPIILLSQLNRGVNGRPNLKNLRDSGEIEESADEVWFVYRPDYNKEVSRQEEKERQPAELIMAKGRTSGVGVVDFYFYPEITLWRDAYIEDGMGEPPIKILRSD